MITMKIAGDQELAASLRAAPGKALAAGSSALNIWATELAGYIKVEKLSGNPLHRRSGRLSASVHPVVVEQGDTVSGGAAAGAGVPYAKIHEFGGLIPAHVVVAKNAQALAIPLPGGTIFRKSASIPDVQMPERSYMRSSLREEGPDGIAQLKAAVMEAVLA